MGANNNNSKPKPDVSKRAERVCLMCRRDFVSEGPHNRRCKRCEAQMGLAEYTGCDTEPYRVLSGTGARGS